MSSRVFSSPFVKFPVFVFVLFAVAFGFAPAGASLDPARADASVWQYRDAHPQGTLPLIVQSQPAADPSALVRAAGGTVRGELGIIHAVAADVPADRLGELTLARGVSWVSLDGGVSATDYGFDYSKFPSSVYPQEVHADKAWSNGNSGQGIGIAVLDTGVFASKDFGSSRLVANVGKAGPNADGFGHGSHVAGLAAGSGANSSGKYRGVAPQANIINVKVGDDQGFATLSDVIDGLQFVLDNQGKYNIRVVNLSLKSDVAQSYTTDPLDAAVELLTFRGILVVVAAGNLGTASDAVSYAPANDPFVLSVGALDDMASSDFKDDQVPSWSSHGTTQDGFAKPDVSVPGRHLISVLSSGSVLATAFPDNVVGNDYFQLSGTSMSAGVASGAAALVIKAHPDWTPGQVKLAFMQTSSSISGPGNPRIALVDRAISLKAPPTDTSLNIKPNFLLLTAAGVADPQSVSWGSVSWGSISWGSISWGSISWGSVSWGSVSWGNVRD
jgi:serine protease AprX